LVDKHFVLNGWLVIFILTKELYFINPLICAGAQWKFERVVDPPGFFAGLEIDDKFHYVLKHNVCLQIDNSILFKSVFFPRIFFTAASVLRRIFHQLFLDLFFLWNIFIYWFCNMVIAFESQIDYTPDVNLYKNWLLNPKIIWTITSVALKLYNSINITEYSVSKLLHKNILYNGLVVVTYPNPI